MLSTDTLGAAILIEKGAISSTTDEENKIKKKFRRQHPALASEQVDDFDVSEEFRGIYKQ